MATVKYSYISLDYDRDLQSPLTEDEYRNLKSKGEKFIDEVAKSSKIGANAYHQLNEVYFHKRLTTVYLICLGTTLLYLTLTLGLEVKSNQIIDLIIGLVGLWVILHPILYVRGYIKTTSEIGHLEISLRHYFRTQNSIVKKSQDYFDYRDILERRTATQN